MYKYTTTLLDHLSFINYNFSRFKNFFIKNRLSSLLNFLCVYTFSTIIYHHTTKCTPMSFIRPHIYVHPTIPISTLISTIEKTNTNMIITLSLIRIKGSHLNNPVNNLFHILSKITLSNLLLLSLLFYIVFTVHCGYKLPDSG